MATRFAISPSAYESVSRTNRQRRAAGRKEDKDSAYSAYRAGLDVSAARAVQAEHLALSKRRLDLLEEGQKDRAKAAEISGGVSLAQTGVMLYDKVAPLFKTGAPEAVGGGAQAAVSTTTAGTGAQAAITTGEIEAGTSAVAETVAGEAVSTGSTLSGTLAAGAGVAAVELTKGPMADWAQDTFGGEADDIVGIGARVGQGAMIGASIGGGYGAAIGTIGGLIVGLGEEVLDGSHLCTAAHKKFSLTKDNIEALGVLKKYAKKNHPKEVEAYMEWCPDVLRRMSKVDRFWFLNRFKRKVVPVITILIRKGKHELAYKLYRKVTEGIFLKHFPEVLEGL